MFAAFHEAISDPFVTVRTHRDRLGRPVVGVMPAYFPLELIHAAGGYPVQLWGAGGAVEHADGHLQSYCCSVSRSLLELEMRGVTGRVDAYAFTSLCDTLVNLREVYRRLFAKPTVEFSIPAAQTRAARKAYLSTVIENVLKGLEAVTGRAASREDLRASAALYGRIRSLQRGIYRIRRQRPGVVNSGDFYAVVKAGFFLPPEDYEPLLARLAAELEALPPRTGRRPRLVVSGMVFEPVAAFGVLDGVPADVVDDDFANGWRSAAKGALRVDDLVAGITDYVYSGAPCCCIYHPESDRHAYLVEKVKAAEADGVLFWAIRFCEPDAFDRPQLAERLKQEGIPAFTLEMDLATGNFESVKTRVEAFCEMIGGLEV